MDTTLSVWLNASLLLCSWIWRKEWWTAFMQNVRQLYYWLAFLLSSLDLWIPLWCISNRIFLSWKIQPYCYVGTPCITDCVMAELEKLGQKYRVALRYVRAQCPNYYVLFNELSLYKCVIWPYLWLVFDIFHFSPLTLVFLMNNRIAKDPRFKRLACTHKGTYADDCIVDRVTQVRFCLLESLIFLVER